MRPFEGTVKLIILMFEADEGLISSQFDKDVLELFLQGIDLFVVEFDLLIVGHCFSFFDILFV